MKTITTTLMDPLAPSVMKRRMISSKERLVSPVISQTAWTVPILQPASSVMNRMTTSCMIRFVRLVASQTALTVPT